MQPTGATTRALAAGADSSSDGNGNGSSSDHNFGKRKKRSGDSKVNPATLGIKKKRPKDSKATVVITDQYSFQETVQKFTGMPTPPAGSTSEESERRPLLFKPRAQRAEINVPLTTFPALSSVLMNSTYCCSLPFADHVLEFPLIESDHPVEIHTSNSMLQLPAFSDNKASNHKSGDSVSLLFEELLEELELTENAAI